MGRAAYPLCRSDRLFASSSFSFFDFVTYATKQLTHALQELTRRSQQDEPQAQSSVPSVIPADRLQFSKEVESFGTRSIFLYKMDIGIRTTAPSREERMRKPLTMEDAAAISGLSSIEAAVPFLDISNNFFGSKITVTALAGDGCHQQQRTQRDPGAEEL